MVTIKAITERVLPDIFYEDPEPVEDHMLQEPTITNLAFVLRRWFSKRNDVFVSAGGFVFWNPANGNERVAPDCYIALQTDPDFVYQFPNYFIWEVGKPPDFVLEVASPSTAPNDLGRKRDLYARLGITEYWRIDPTGGDLYGDALVGERLVDGEYVPYDTNAEPDGSVWSRSEALYLNFYWDGEHFDILDPLTGKTIDPVETERQARLEFEAQAETERQARLDAEAQAEFERQARLESEAQAESERQARLDAEAQVRRLMEENERLRRHQSEG